MIIPDRRYAVPARVQIASLIIIIIISSIVNGRSLCTPKSMPPTGDKRKTQSQGPQQQNTRKERGKNLKYIKTLPATRHRLTTPHTFRLTTPCTRVRMHTHARTATRPGPHSTLPHTSPMGAPSCPPAAPLPPSVLLCPVLPPSTDQSNPNTGIRH